MSSPVFVQDLERGVLVERADGVRADAEMLFHFALNGLAGASTGLIFKPVSVFSVSSPCVANKRLVATSTVPFTRAGAAIPL